MIRGDIRQRAVDASPAKSVWCGPCHSQWEVFVAWRSWCDGHCGPGRRSGQRTRDVRQRGRAGTRFAQPCGDEHKIAPDTQLSKRGHMFVYLWRHVCARVRCVAPLWVACDIDCGGRSLCVTGCVCALQFALDLYAVCRIGCSWVL